jgi:hypothetical protein
MMAMSIATDTDDDDHVHGGDTMLMLMTTMTSLLTTTTMATATATTTTTTVTPMRRLDDDDDLDVEPCLSNLKAPLFEKIMSYLPLKDVLSVGEASTTLRVRATSNSLWLGLDRACRYDAARLVIGRATSFPLTLWFFRFSLFLCSMCAMFALLPLGAHRRRKVRAGRLGAILQAVFRTQVLAVHRCRRSKGIHGQNHVEALPLLLRTSGALTKQTPTGKV